MVEGKISWDAYHSESYELQQPINRLASRNTDENGISRDNVRIQMEKG